MTDKENSDLLTEEGRKRYEEALKKRRAITQPLIDEVTESERITAEDLGTRVTEKGDFWWDDE